MITPYVANSSYILTVMILIYAFFQIVKHVPLLNLDWSKSGGRFGLELKC